MKTRILRIYADTSVFGGVFDPEFSEPSKEMFREVRYGTLSLVISPLIVEELQCAPQEVREWLEETAPHAELISLSDESRTLRDAYLHAGIISRKYLTDAFHVALATVSECRAIVSWNFKHIVHFERIPLYNGINRIHGYSEIGIHTPPEVIRYEDEEV